MQITKFRISAESTGKLRVLRQKAALTPNLLCRMAMVSSFETGPIGPYPVDVEEGQEFNAYTLFGADQPLFVSMLKLVESESAELPLDEDDLLRRLRGHIDRGISQLAIRISSPADAGRVLAGFSS